MDKKKKAHEESIFKSLLQAAPDGILVCDHNGIITLANEQCTQLLGYSQQELIGQAIEILVPAYIRPKHASLRDAYFANPHRRPMGIGLDLTAERKDGSTVAVEISLSPVDLGGEHCAVAVVRDVTELRRLDREIKRNNEELRRSNDELEKFAYVASHDLQEPLRMVAGYTQLLQRRYGDKLDSDAHEYIGYAVDGVKRMQLLINDLLMYSRLSTRTKEFTPVSCSDVIRQVTANLGLAIEETKATIHAESLPEVRGDFVQLTQLFQNLIGNALKFHKDGVAPVITISAKRDGQFWHFAVNDNGIGIESQYSEKIFVIFQRLHTREKYPGTGIGLAICKKVVERHGGQIWLESTPGAGTTFYFTLPALEDAP